MTIIRLIIGGIILYFIFLFYIGTGYFIISIKASFGVLVPVYVAAAYGLGWAVTAVLAKIKYTIFEVNSKGTLMNLGLIAAVIAYVVSLFALRTLPSPENIWPELFRNPVQTATERERFSFEYRGTTYDVKPLADYELWGLIVSHNDITKWYNYYHDKNTVNIKDICVVWGDNVKSDVYRGLKYSSGEWTCYFSTDSGEIYQQFTPNQLSNNHLLSDNEAVRHTINNMRVGDQVHVKGTLAAYGPKGTPEKYFRSSSLSRSDQGTGACEVMFVDTAEILTRGMPLWYAVRTYTKVLFGVIILLKIVLFFIENKKVLMSSKI